MSMYNLVFGQNPASDVLLALLNLTRQDVGRFRDVTVSDGTIAVYTRNGGGNREHYPDDQEAGESCHCTGCIITYHLPKHPNYIRDIDDDFDQTYATIYFSFPPEYADDLKKLDSGEVFDPSQRWLDKIEALKKSMPVPE